MAVVITIHITDLFKVVSNKKAEVEAAEKESKQSWKTNCSFHIDGMATPINIQTANEATLKRVVVALLQNREYSQQADALLGVEISTRIDGFSYNDWIADCKKRMTVIGLRAKKDNLAALEKRLNAIISPELLRKMELDAIAASLND